eukprot:COSAG02_NODE_8341_length_2607_cov_1.547448_1_plen_74_part_10
MQSDCLWMTIQQAGRKQSESFIFLKTLNWRAGTGDNSEGNWSRHEFQKPILCFRPRAIRRSMLLVGCIVLREQM